jgi:2-methylisocitrate lyase-like PEP mutase family enzyme
MKAAGETLAELLRRGTQRDLLAKMQTRAELYDLLDYTEWEARDGQFVQG